MYKIVNAMKEIAIELGVEFHFNNNVNRFDIKNNKIKELL